MTLSDAVRRAAGTTFALVVAQLLLLAQSQTRGQIESFTGTTVNLSPGSGETLRMDVVAWATDAERDELLAVFKEKGDSGLDEALEKAPTAGYIWDGGAIGYSVRYAQKGMLPDAGERVVLVTDRPLGSWDRETWKATGPAATPGYRFTVIELRINKQGLGEGKMSLAAKVTADVDAKTFMLENYASVPVLIHNVRRAARLAE